MPSGVRAVRRSPCKGWSGSAGRPRILQNVRPDVYKRQEVGEAIQAECARQRRNLELIASENIVSEPVMMAMGTVLTNKYAEGYSGKRYYGG